MKQTQWRCVSLTMSQITCPKTICWRFLMIYVKYDVMLKMTSRTQKVIARLKIMIIIILQE